MASTPLLAIDRLCVDFTLPSGVLRVVHDITLEVGAGECLAVVGESGSGKTQTFLACLGLLAPNGRASGSARFEGRELLGAGEAGLNRVRGTRIATVFQDPMNALTPHLTAGEQLTEVLTAHRLADEGTARKRAVEALREVGLADPARRYGQYPHELSGGQRQRVVIAMALMAGPALLVADEPTTALDTKSQAQVLALLRSFRARGLAIVLVTHDLGLLAGFADRVVVMYGGRVIEQGSTAALLAAPRHPYTAALLHSVPRANARHGEPLAAIQGQPPRSGESLPGCAFEPRCPLRIARCAAERPTLHGAPGAGEVACHVAMPR